MQQERARTTEPAESKEIADVKKLTRGRTNTGSLTPNKGRRREARQNQSAASNRPALHILLSNTIEFLLSTGESPESVALELKGQARRVNGRGHLWRPKEAKHVQDANEIRIEICGVVHDWHREPAYTNQDGDPVQLTQRSLRTLVSKRFPRQNVSVAIRWMFENGVIRKTKRGKIALVGGRQVVLRDGQRAVSLNRAAALVPQYLRTALRNADTQNPSSRDIDRDARVFYLPEKYVPLWREVARERARAFLEGVDNWLEDHARRDDAGLVREVAMHCYAYTGDSRPPRAIRTNARLKAAD